MSLAPVRIEEESEWPLFATITLDGQPCPAFLANKMGIQVAEFGGRSVVLLAMRVAGSPAIYQPMDRLTAETMISIIRTSLDEADLANSLATQARPVSRRFSRPEDGGLCL